MRRVTAAREERQPDQADQPRDLQHGEHVLHAGTQFRASRVDEGEAQEDPDADDLLDPERQRQEQFQIQQKRAGQRRHVAGNDDQHDRPPVEEPPERSVRLPHVHVEPARFGQHGAQLRQCERAAQHEQP